VDTLPRGELFLGSDFLNYYFPHLAEEPVRQIQEAASSLGLSLVGVDLNGEKSHALLSEKAYKTLDSYFVAGFVNGPVSALIQEHGFRESMLSMRNNPSLFLETASSLIDTLHPIVFNAKRNGFSCIVLADDIAGKNGLLFSARYFKEAVLPVYARIAEIIREAGLHAFIHSDGDIRNIIDLITDAGYDCIHPVDAQSGLDVNTLADRFGERISFMGHIDMLGWDTRRIEREIAAAQDSFRNGGLILGSAGGISMQIPEDRLRILYPSLVQERN
jgi:hypothetical protein